MRKLNYFLLGVLLSFLLNASAFAEVFYPLKELVKEQGGPIYVPPPSRAPKPYKAPTTQYIYIIGSDSDGGHRNQIHDHDRIRPNVWGGGAYQRY